MAKTSTFAVTNAATAVTPSVATKSITIREDPSVANWPTSDFLVAAPGSSNTFIQVPAGTSFTIDCPVHFWPANRPVGYVKLVTGTSSTFQQYETGV